MRQWIGGERTAAFDPENPSLQPSPAHDVDEIQTRFRIGGVVAIHTDRRHPEHRVLAEQIEPFAKFSVIEQPRLAVEELLYRRLRNGVSHGALRRAPSTQPTPIDTLHRDLVVPTVAGGQRIHAELARGRVRPVDLESCRGPYWSSGC